MSAALGLDLGGTNMKAAVVHDSGEILASKSIPTLSSQGIRSTIDRMAALMTDGRRSRAAANQPSGNYGSGGDQLLRRNR